MQTKFLVPEGSGFSRLWPLTNNNVWRAFWPAVFSKMWARNLPKKTNTEKMKKKERRPIWQYSDEVQDRGEMFVAVMNITEWHARMTTARLKSKIDEFIIRLNTRQITRWNEPGATWNPAAISEGCLWWKSSTGDASRQNSTVSHWKVLHYWGEIRWWRPE